VFFDDIGGRTASSGRSASSEWVTHYVYQTRKPETPALPAWTVLPAGPASPAGAGQDNVVVTVTPGDPGACSDAASHGGDAASVHSCHRPAADLSVSARSVDSQEKPSRPKWP
jgi:hypothetical protein